MGYATPPAVLRENIIYLIGRLIPAGIGLAAVAIYTHLVLPDVYGRYALYFTAANLINVSIFQWLRMAVVRQHIPSERQAQFRFAVLASFIFLTITTVSGSLALSMLPGWQSERSYLFAAAFLGVATAWAELNQDWLRARQQAMRYVALHTARVLLGLILSVFFIEHDHGATGMLLGLALGNILPTLPLLLNNWAQTFSRTFSGDELRRLLGYGLPLSASFTINGLSNTIDRTVLGFFHGAAAVGPFAVAFDMARGSLWVVAQGSNLAAVPRAARAMARHGVKAAQVQLRHNLHFMLAILLPAGLGLYLVSDMICHLLLAPAYSAAAAELMPPVILATVIGCLKMFYTDQSFQLASRAKTQLALTIITLATGLAAALVLIPPLGAAGAGWSGVIAYSISVALGFMYSRDAVPLPFPKWRSIIILFVALLLMGLSVKLIRFFTDGWIGFLICIATGGAVYLAALLMLDFEGYSTRFRTMNTRKSE